MQEQFTIQNHLGIHVRPAKQLVALAMQYPCAISIEKNGTRFNAKSLLSLLSAEIKYGETVVLIAEGEGEADAIRILGVQLLKPIG